MIEEKNLPDLFSTPISKTKVRRGIYAYKYRNGCINISGEKFFDYSIKDAIKIWRKNNPVNGYERKKVSLNMDKNFTAVFMGLGF